MKNLKFDKVFTVHPPKLNDTLHADGSKTYETCNYGYITIKNPALVIFLEQQIAIDGYGYYYIEALMKFKDSGQDIYDEIENVLRILD